MEHEKVIASNGAVGKVHDNDHIEALSHERSYNDPSYNDHRADDDRADVAKGRNSDKFEKKYWLSVNFIGTMFAIGMAFMGGIGGKPPYREIHPVLFTELIENSRLRSHCTSSW